MRQFMLFTPDSIYQIKTTTSIIIKATAASYHFHTLLIRMALQTQTHTDWHTDDTHETLNAGILKHYFIYIKMYHRCGTAWHIPHAHQLPA